MWRIKYSNNSIKNDKPLTLNRSPKSVIPQISGEYQPGDIKNRYNSFFSVIASARYPTFGLWVFRPNVSGAQSPCLHPALISVTSFLPSLTQLISLYCAVRVFICMCWISLLPKTQFFGIDSLFHLSLSFWLTGINEHFRHGLWGPCMFYTSYHRPFHWRQTETYRLNRDDKSSH